MGNLTSNISWLLGLKQQESHSAPPLAHQHPAPRILAATSIEGVVRWLPANISIPTAHVATAATSQLAAQKLLLGLIVHHLRTGSSVYDTIRW